MDLGGLYVSFVPIFLCIPKTSGTVAQTRHIRSKYLQDQPRQIQIFTLGGTLITFSYNHQRSKTNIANYLIKVEQLFNFAENEAFTNFIKTTHNPEYHPY